MEEIMRSRDPGAMVSSSTPDPNHQYAQTGQTTDLRKIWAMVAKRKLFIAVTVVAVLAPTAIFTFLATPIYLSTATIQIEPESVKVLPYRDVSESIMNSPPDFELYMKTQDELLKNPTLAARTITRLKNEFSQFIHSDLDEDFSESLRVERIQGSQVVKINYLSDDPQLSAAAANILAEEFTKLHFERKYDTAKKAAAFLENQLRGLKAKVEAAEAELLEYARNHDILTIDGKQENVIRQKFGFLSAEVAKAETGFIAKKAAYDGLASLSPDELPEKMKSPAIAALESRAHQAEQELSKLQSQFDENWPAVIQKKQELALVNEQLAKERAAALARVRKQAQVEYGTARNEYQMLAKAYKDQSQLVDQLNEATVQYNNYKRDLDTSEQLYQGLLQRLKETGVSAGLEFGNIQIADRAKPASVPYRPRKVWNLSLALLLGLSAGIGLAFVIEHLDRTLRNPADVEKLGLPLLGWIPITSSANGQTRIAKSGQTTSSALSPSVNPGPLHGVEQRSRLKLDWRFNESYRSLCASMLLSKAERPPRSILITSAIPREGKTTTVANLGCALAETGARTLLIDSDFRNPSLSHRFGFDRGKGLSVFLAGAELEIKETGIANLFLVTSGPAPPNPVALLSSPRFAEALDRLSREFRFILIDSPPLLSVADARLLAPRVDGVILVVKAGETPQPLLKVANLQLIRAGACVLGAAVNYLDLRNPEHSYYRKYYYHNRYRSTVQTRDPRVM